MPLPLPLQTLTCNVIYFVILFNVNNTRESLQSPEPVARDNVLDNNPDRIGMEFGNVDMIDMIDI